MLQFVTDTLGWRFLLAFVLSVTLWARLTIDQNPQRQDVYPSDIPVETRGLKSNLVVANEIQPIKVRIAAPRESWSRLSVGSFRAMVDLSNAGAGLVQPEVQVEVSDPEVQVLERLPAKVSVRIEELRSTTVPVRVNQIGSLQFGFRLVSDPVAVPATVEVSGPASAVEKVSEAAVAVRMEDVKNTIDRTLKPEPRGASGVVTGVRVEPQSVTVTVPVEQIAGSRAVAVIPQVRGQPAPGYWLGPITVDPPTVQIVGDPSLLDSIGVVQTAEVDVTGAQGEVARTVAIIRQTGVTIVRDQAATVRVSIQPLQSQQVREVPVTVQNVAAGLGASVAPASVSVVVSGPQPALLRLGPADVVATVDVDGQGPGTIQAAVSVRAPDGLRAAPPQPDRVSVTLTPQTATP